MYYILLNSFLLLSLSRLKPLEIFIEIIFVGP